MATIILLSLLLLAACGGFAATWLRLTQLSSEVTQLRASLEALERAPRRTAAAARKRPEAVFATLAEAREGAPVAGGTEASRWIAPDDGGAKPPKAPARPLVAVDEIDDSAWSVASRMPPDTVRAFIAALIVGAPALGFIFSLPALAVTFTGLALAALVVLASVHLRWTAPVWVAALGAGAWALTGLQSGAAASNPAVFAAMLASTASAGFVHTIVHRRAWSGAALALFMAAAALRFGAATALIGAPGLAFGAIVAGAAAIGAARLRRDGLHLAAFGAAVVGLVILSGQREAAIWFTPVAAWVGAIFFGITAVRVPMLGARGALLACTGVAATMFAAATLYGSQQGLADPRAAAGAFASLALLFSGVLALAARRAKTIGALKMTAWVLVAAIAAAASSAILIAMPAPFAAAMLAALALTFVGADQRWPDDVWRFFAVCLAAAACAVGFGAISGIGATQALGGGYGTGLLALAMPASFLALAARRSGPVTSGLMEMGAIALTLAFLTVIVRVFFSAGAPALQAVSFIEAGVHVSIWAGLALFLGARSNKGAGDVRRAFAAVLGSASIGAVVVGTALWLTPFWKSRPEQAVEWPLAQHLPFGFALPAILAWAHWIYWRDRQAPLRTRVSLGAAGLLTAAYLGFETYTLRNPTPLNLGVDWVAISVGVVAAIAATGLHFAPGAVPPASTQLDLEEYLKRHG